MTQAEYYKNNEYDVKKSGGKKWEQHSSFEKKIMKSDATKENENEVFNKFA